MLGAKRHFFGRGIIETTLSALLLLALVQPIQAQRQPLPPAEQRAVNRAILRGVHYLKTTQLGNGSWPQLKGKHPVGYATLPALTLLECGVSPKDPVIQRTAAFLRTYASKTLLDTTYELSLAILFLDRLGNPRDEKIIRVFALRLIAGQSATGGWGYKCPILNASDHRDLMIALRHLEPPPGDMPFLRGGQPPLPGIAKRPRRGEDLKPIARQSDGTLLQEIASLSHNPAPSDTTASRADDESRSPQHTLAAEPKREGEQRHDSSTDLADSTPIDKKLKDTPKQQAKDGPPVKHKEKDTKAKEAKPAAKHHNPYVIPKRLHVLTVVQDPARHLLMDPVKKSKSLIVTTTDNSNTQFAILALWTAQRHGVPMKRTLNLIVRRYATSQNADGGWGYHYLYGGGVSTTAPMTCVGLIGLAVGHGLANRAADKPIRAPRILNGFAALSKSVGQPQEPPFDVSMQNLYYLWSLERVAVLYGLPLIGDKDWYRWGAQTLIVYQTRAGCWIEGGYHGSSPPIDTCLALLFLKRANLVADLTSRLPFKPAELNAGVLRKLAPPPSKKEEKPISDPAPLTRLSNVAEPAAPDKPIAKPTESAAPDNLIAKPIGQAPSTATTDSAAANNGKKKWIILLSVLLAVLLVGGVCLVYMILANGKKAAKEENKRRHRQVPVT